MFFIEYKITVSSYDYELLLKIPILFFEAFINANREPESDEMLSKVDKMIMDYYREEKIGIGYRNARPENKKPEEIFISNKKYLELNKWGATKSVADLIFFAIKYHKDIFDLLVFLVKLNSQEPKFKRRVLMEPELIKTFISAQLKLMRRIAAERKQRNANLSPIIFKSNISKDTNDSLE